MGKEPKEYEKQDENWKAEGEGGYLHLLEDLSTRHGLLYFSFCKEQESNRKKQRGSDRASSDPQDIRYSVSEVFAVDSWRRRPQLHTRGPPYPRWRLGGVCFAPKGKRSMGNPSLTKKKDPAAVLFCCLTWNFLKEPVEIFHPNKKRRDEMTMCSFL